jgi:TonB family protein
MSLLLDSTFKVSVVILAGLAATMLLRKRSAAIRHWALAAAILCATLMPALQLVVPAWQIGFALDGPSREASVEVGPVGFEVSRAAPLLPQEPATLTSSSARRLATSGLLASAWIIGSGVSLLILLVGLTRLAWLASRARPVPNGTWTRLAHAIGRDYSLRWPVQLLQTDHPSLLVTWGLVRPKIIIPRAAEHWTEDRVAIVLRHELAHIRRGDWVVQIAGELLRAAYWFNPLVWIACSRLRQESEQACDDEVLVRGVEGPDYATHLLEVARALKVDSAPRLPAPAVARSSSLERRIRAMLDARLIRNPTTRSARFLTAAALLSLTVGIAAAQTGPVTLSGSVFDSTGAPVPGATVVLTNVQNGAKFVVTTDSGGQFSFVPLPADSYTLAAEVPGFKKLESQVALSGKSVRRDLTLSLGELQETISVRGSREAADKLTPNNRTAAAGTVTTADLDRSSYLAALAGCTPSTTGGRIRPPRKIKDVRPIYPASLQQAGVQGKVGLEAIIGTDGTIREATVVDSVHPELDAAAVEAVRQWQFDGTLVNCSPAEVKMRVSITFAVD